MSGLRLTMVPDMTPSPPPQRRNPQGWKHVITGSLGPELELKEPGAAEERKGWGEGVRCRPHHQHAGARNRVADGCSPGNEATGSWGGRSAALGSADWGELTFIEVQPTVP